MGSYNGQKVYKFQFPPPRGGERGLVENEDFEVVFQFPPPRGGEPGKPGLLAGFGCYFNSRPREGANRRESWDFQTLEISIPAPARGRT